jgi:hypothetical protein
MGNGRAETAGGGVPMKVYYRMHDGEKKCVDVGVYSDLTGVRIRTIILPHWEAQRILCSREATEWWLHALASNPQGINLIVR